MDRELSVQYKRALIVPETIDRDKREIEVTFATETPVFRTGWTEDYNEVLSCNPKSVRMDRANKGLPVIDSHDNSSVLNQFGRTIKVWFEDKVGRATVRFSRRPEVDGIFQDIIDGILGEISVGYRVHKFEREPGTEKVPTYRGIDWEPHEISLVPVGADPNCGFRGDSDKNSVEIVERQIINKSSIHLKKRAMIEITCPECGHQWETDEADSYTCPECGASFSDGERSATVTGVRSVTPPVTPQPKPEPALDVAAIRAQATSDEQKRLNAILVSSRAARLNDSVAIELFNSGKSLDECRHDIIMRAVESGKVNVNGTHAATVGASAIEKKRGAAQNAILARALPNAFKLESGNYFYGMTLVEMTKELAQERGIDLRGKSKSAIWEWQQSQRAHSTSDFPILFEEALNKVLRADYTWMPEQWDQIARATTVSDFRYRNFYQVESVNGMAETPEGGEIKYTTMLEAKQRIKVKKFAEGIKFTREAFINDDLSSLAIIPNRFVKDWDELRGDLVWGLVTDNVVMDDGKPLFSTDHDNLLTGATSAFSDAGLEAALLVFRNQKALGGKRRIRVNPRTVIVPPQLEIAAKKQLTAINPTTVGDINVWAGVYNIIVEPRLTDPKEWYLIANPNEIEGLYYAYLDGNEGLRVNSEDDFNTDTMKYAVRGEFGTAAVDYRGWVKCKGV